MQKLFRNILKLLFPEHIKRIIFCVTVYGHIASETGYRVGDRELTQLNRALKLAKRIKGMVFPIAWSDAIWSAIPTPPLDDDKRTTFITSVLEHTPVYLFYESEQMKADLNKVLDVFFQEREISDCITDIREHGA